MLNFKITKKLISCFWVFLSIFTIHNYSKFAFNIFLTEIIYEMLFIYINFVVFNENQILLLYFSLKVRQQVYCGDKKNITPNQLKCISNLQTAQ